MKTIRVLVIISVLAAGCRQQMADQPRYDPFEASAFFGDGQSARLLVPGTVARGQLREDDHFYAGVSGNVPVTTFPFPVTLEILERGQERYNIYCSPCHSRIGDGDGMIVRRGFIRPPSFHSERMRKQPPGHFFRIITQGIGAMPDYRHQMTPHDRWAVVAYIHALQLSQSANVSAVPPEKRDQLTGGER